MGKFSGFRLHPKKLWECDCCFGVYSCRATDLNGGFCPSCGFEYFSPVDDSIPLYVPDKAPDRKPVPTVKKTVEAIE